jgi:hypothetical protein
VPGIGFRINCFHQLTDQRFLGENLGSFLQEEEEDWRRREEYF